MVPFGDGAYVYDAVTRVHHRVGPAAAAVLLNGAKQSVDNLLDVNPGISEALADEQRHAIETGIEALRAAGLVDRTEPWWAPDPVGGSDVGRPDVPTGTPHTVHDRLVRFRSSDTRLLERIDAYVGTGSSPHPARPEPGSPPDDVVFDVDPTAEGGLRLHASEEWVFSTVEGFFVQLPGVINDFASRSHTTVVLHAGGVLLPSGRLVLVSGEAESGKSTLVGALVQQGCGYLGDELIAIDFHTLEALPYPKPLELDEVSCDVLGVRAEHPPNVLAAEIRRDAEMIHEAVGPVAEVILPTYRAGPEQETTRLDVEEAAKALLDQTVNMRRVREPGLRAVCELATRTPVTRIVHSGSVELAAGIVERDATGASFA